VTDTLASSLELLFAKVKMCF